MWPTQPPIQSPSEKLSPGGKRPERDPDHSSSHNDQGYQVWPYSEGKLNPYPISIFTVGIPLYYMMQYLDTRGGTTIIPLISFSGSIITIIIKFTYTKGTPFTTLRLFLNKVSFAINILFPPIRETLYVGRVDPSAEASGLFTHAVLQLVVVVVVRKTASSECLHQGTKNMEVGGCQIGNVERMSKNTGPANTQHTDNS